MYLILNVWWQYCKDYLKKSVIVYHKSSEAHCVLSLDKLSYLESYIKLGKSCPPHLNSCKCDKQWYNSGGVGGREKIPEQGFHIL